MALVLRQTKGAALTFTELDGNFTYLSQSIATSGNYFTLSGANVTTVYGGSFSGAVTASAIYTPGIVIGSQGKFSLSGNNTTPLNIIGNSTSSNASQLQIQGYTNNNQSLLIGYNTTSSYASIQSLTQGSTYNPLVINPSGGNVGINKFSPSASLDVYGNTLITGSLGVTGSISLVGNETIIGSEIISGSLAFNPTGYIIFSTQNVAASGSGQSSATTVVADNTYVSSGTGGVILPSITPGREISITNNTSNIIQVYPSNGSSIENSSVNFPTALPAYATIALAAKSSTNWWTVTPVYSTGSGITITQSANGTVTWALSNSITASLQGTASYSNQSLSASYATTSSYSLVASSSNTLNSSNNYAIGQLTASSALFSGTITAQTLVVQTVTSSIEYSSGSNIFGNSLSNTQTFTGSVNITGSLNVSGSGNITGNVTALGFYNSSDINLKEVLSTPIDLNKLRQIETLSYTWKDKIDDKVHYGHSAQQVEKYYPELVIIKENGYKSLNYTELHTLQIEYLKGEIQKLKDIISDITNK